MIQRDRSIRVIGAVVEIHIEKVRSSGERYQILDVFHVATEVISDFGICAGMTITVFEKFLLLICKRITIRHERHLHDGIITQEKGA